MKFEEAREIAQNMRNRGRALEKEGDILSEIAIALVILDDRVNELETERLHLRALIRGEQIKPPFDIKDDVTTELAVALADMEKQRDELVEALLGFALKTSHHTPSLSREWLQAIKLISSIKGKPWEEIEASDKEV